MNLPAMQAPMSLDNLLHGIVADAPALSIGRLCLDSRALTPGDLFIALRGHKLDGRAYLVEAQQAGAAAALVEDYVSTELPTPSVMPTVVVPRLRERLGEIASRFYGNPSHGMHVAAVTGTNGKTTVSQLFAQLVRAVGYDCGVIGTLGASLDAQAHLAVHTTPDPIALQATLASWAGQVVPFVGMEASSHALDQGRMNGVEIDTAVFTNLTRDHLDYHGDMRAYGAAKARLFSMSGLRAAIINVDDPFGADLSTRLPSTVDVLRYGMQAKSLDIGVRQVSTGGAGLKFRFESPWGSAVLRCPLVGAFNALNLGAALAAALQSGLPFDALVQAVEGLAPVAGRMQPLKLARGPLVVVDYAHTPDALQQALSTLREQLRGRLTVVFGCGGDRDRGKRALMGEAASEHADAAILTSDNPRSEDPDSIITDIEAGMSIDYQICADRAEAISLAIRSAGADDCVLIAGKGHEDYQLVGDQRLPFSDLDLARRVLAELEG